MKTKSANQLQKVVDVVEKYELFWRHNEDCEPLSVEGCKCGLWELERAMDALKEKDDAKD